MESRKSFGLGDFMGYDLPTGKRNVPSSKTYKKSIQMEDGSTTIVSNAIGQGKF
jgi:penicillin-binding protein 2